MTAPDLVALPIGYIPKDWLAYAALIREGREPGVAFLANPFTPEPQSGRVILLFHQALNAVFRATGIDPFLLLELSRPVLLAGLVLVLWWFTGLVLERTVDRAWACWLALLSGGLGSLLLGHPGLPPLASAAIEGDLWILTGWSTFDSLFNPLWIAGYVLALLVLGKALRPGGPATLRDGAILSAAFAALWFTHVYSALATLFIVVAAFGVEWILSDDVQWGAMGRRTLAFAPAVLLVLLVTGWQFADPVFRESSSGVLGPQAIPVFWYPVTLGIVGVLALRGLGRWAAAREPWRYALGGWIGGIALLHSSPLVNGYKFLPFLHLPLCLVAAPVAASAFARYVRGGPAGLVRATALGALLFANPVTATYLSVIETDGHVIPAQVARLLDRLATLPPGNVLAPAWLGNLVPAFGPHRVYVGHWFMTPGYAARAALYDQMVLHPEDGRLARVLAQDDIRYLVAPAAQASLIAQGTGFEPEVFGDWALLAVPRPPRLPDAR